MHHALEAIATEDLSSLHVAMEEAPGYVAMKFDPNADTDPIELANLATLLVANIASLKDHLHLWCKTKGIQFKGDDLINSNLSVALIHDLWNIDKHAELNRPPRSGSTPKLKDLRKSLILSTGTEAGASVMFSIDPRTGIPSVTRSGSGSAKLSLTALVVDETGKTLGELSDLCGKAVAAWENELVSAGVRLP
jgi:hypothetical protein